MDIERKIGHRRELKRGQTKIKSFGNESTFGATSKKQKKRASNLVPFKDDSDSVRTRKSNDDEFNNSLDGLKSFAESLLEDLETKSQNMMMLMKKELHKLVEVDNISSLCERKKNARARFGRLRVKGKSQLGAESSDKTREKSDNANEMFKISRKEKGENSRFFVGPDMMTCLYYQVLTSMSLMQSHFAQSYLYEFLHDQSSSSRETSTELIINYNKYILESKKEERNRIFAGLNSASSIQRSNPTSPLDQTVDSSTHRNPLAFKNQIWGKNYNSGVSLASQAITLSGLRRYATDNLTRLNSLPNSKP